MKSYIILFTCAHNTEGGGAFTLSIALYGWSFHHPESLEQFVRGLRDLGEQDQTTVGSAIQISKRLEAEIPQRWSGMDFREVIGSRYHPKSGATDYIGLTCTYI